MIPIICSSAQQVVLIGDEKELSPWPRDGSIQREDHCLKRSLLQRYATKAQVILNCHYRMVSVLCIKLLKLEQIGGQAFHVILSVSVKSCDQELINKNLQLNLFAA